MLDDYCFNFFPHIVNSIDGVTDSILTNKSCKFSF